MTKPKIVNKKITLSSDELWIIRSIKTPPDGKKETRYYETPSMWARAPTKATIFTSMEAANAHLWLLTHRDLKDSKSYADGSAEEFDVVSFYTEIIHSPNGMVIELKKRR